MAGIVASITDARCPCFALAEWSGRTRRARVHAVCNSWCMQNRIEADAAPDMAGAAEVLDLVSRVLTGVTLRGLALSSAAMSVAQFRLLALFAEAGPVTAGQAARALRLTESATATRAARLVVAGLARSYRPRTGSLPVFEVTERGRDTVQRVAHWRRRELTQILNHLLPAQRADTVRAMREFVDAAARCGYGGGELGRELHASG